MAKTYSELLVVIAQKDLALAKLRLEVERVKQDYNLAATMKADAHNRDLSTMASEYRESLREKENQIEYWRDEVVKARRERDSLYSKIEREKEETKLALQRVERLKKRLDNIVEVFSNPTPPDSRLARGGETPDFVLGGLDFVIDTENFRKSVGLLVDSSETLETEREFIELLGFEDTLETLEDSPLTGEDSSETPKGWDSV